MNTRPMDDRYPYCGMQVSFGNLCMSDGQSEYILTSKELLRAVLIAIDGGLVTCEDIEQIVKTCKGEKMMATDCALKRIGDALQKADFWELDTKAGCDQILHKDGFIHRKDNGTRTFVLTINGGAKDKTVK